jgi:hypothetical protein
LGLRLVIQKLRVTDVSADRMLHDVRMAALTGRIEAFAFLLEQQLWAVHVKI